RQPARLDAQRQRPADGHSPRTEGGSGSCLPEGLDPVHPGRSAAGGCVTAKKAKPPSPFIGLWHIVSTGDYPETMDGFRRRPARASLESLGVLFCVGSVPRWLVRSRSGPPRRRGGERSRGAIPPPHGV